MIETPVIVKLDLEKWEYVNPDKIELYKGNFCIYMNEKLIYTDSISLAEPDAAYMYMIRSGWEDEKELLIEVKRDFTQMMIGFPSLQADGKVPVKEGEPVILVAADQAVDWGAVLTQFSGLDLVKYWMVQEHWAAKQK